MTHGTQMNKKTCTALWPGELNQNSFKNKDKTCIRVSHLIFKSKIIVSIMWDTVSYKVLICVNLKL